MRAEGVGQLQLHLTLHRRVLSWRVVEIETRSYSWYGRLVIDWSQSIVTRLQSIDSQWNKKDPSSDKAYTAFLQYIAVALETSLTESRASGYAGVAIPSLFLGDGRGRVEGDGDLLHAVVLD